MQHIVNIAFDFDDEKAKLAAEKAVESELASVIRDIVTDKIAPMETGFYGRKERNWEKFTGRVDDAINTFMAENKDTILDYAADKLAKSLRNTKAWKEKYSAVMENGA